MRGYISLCYHYIRPDTIENEFPNLLGNTQTEFRNHLSFLKKKYSLMSPDDVLNFSYSSPEVKSDKLGMHITFDDGLYDHLSAAIILAEEKIKASFFIPTCILDNEPANPIIIHYALAIYRISGFLRAYKTALDRLKLDLLKHDIIWSGKKEDSWTTINLIKSKFKYDFSYTEGRKILLDIYYNLLKKQDKDIFHKMHLNKDDIKTILSLGHSIGTHTRSHISVASSKLSKANFEREINEPQQLMEKTFGTKINSMSYPYGDRKDCLTIEQMIKNSNNYKLAFTVENKVNTKLTSPFNLGRLMPWGVRP